MRNARVFGGKLALGIGLAGLLTAMQLQAQQAPPAWKQGMPDSMKDSKLAPHAIPLTVTAPEKIPYAKLKVPAGFKVELWAHSMPGARMMTRGDKGTIFVGTRAIGKVYAITDKDGQRTHKVIAEGLQQPNGLAFKNGTLFVITVDKAVRFDGIEDKLGAPQMTDVSEQLKMPASTHHNWKFAAIGPDGKLYVAIGSPCNVCEIIPACTG